MYAIVEIQGQQFKVEAGKKLFVNRLDAERGAEVSFEKVMLVENENGVKIGTPYVEGAKVVCEVLSHLKGDKVIVFKKKRRKGYRKLNGFRPYLSELRIKELVVA